MKLVIIESPFAGDLRKNRRYARAALKHSLSLGEAPLASHLLYPQVLDENSSEQRAQGIAAGLAWAERADLAAFYVDLGRLSPGMVQALQFYTEIGLPVEFRLLYKHKRSSTPQPPTSENAA
jgi:hypothetical protein